MRRNLEILIAVVITCLTSTALCAKSATSQEVFIGPQTPNPPGPSTGASSVAPIPEASTVDEKKQPWTKSFAEFSQGFAFVAAALFFLWKLAAGYLAINLTIAIETRRYRRSDTRDNLVIKVSLEKGDRESAVLESVILNMTELEQTTEYSSSLDSSSTVFNHGAADALATIEITEDTKIELRDGAGRAIRLSPGETAAFEHMVDVPAASAVKIAAQVTAKTGFLWILSPTSYSRGTLVSVPADRYKPENVHDKATQNE